MKKLKLLMVLFVITVTYSCTSDEVNTVNADEFNVKKAYNKVINSKQPKEAFEIYNSYEKAKLWEFKYNLFIKKSKLTNKQISLVNELKDNAVKAITDENFDENDFELLNSKLMKNFDNAQYFNLLYFLDNPSLNTDTNKVVNGDNNSDPDTTTGSCFWCTMYVTTGPCHYDSHGCPVQNANFFTCRFWVCSDAGGGTVPCQGLQGSEM